MHVVSEFKTAVYFILFDTSHAILGMNCVRPLKLLSWCLFDQRLVTRRTTRDREQTDRHTKRTTKTNQYYNKIYQLYRVRSFFWRSNSGSFQFPFRWEFVFMCDVIGRTCQGCHVLAVSLIASEPVKGRIVIHWKQLYVITG